MYIPVAALAAAPHMAATTNGAPAPSVAAVTAIPAMAAPTWTAMSA